MRTEKTDEEKSWRKNEVSKEKRQTGRHYSLKLPLVGIAVIRAADHPNRSLINVRVRWILMGDYIS